MSARTQANGRSERGDWARRHNQALVALARQVWHERCTLQAAYANICETAARILKVDRVGIWQLDATRTRITCVHLYHRADDRHSLPETLETLSLGGEYGVRLREMRAMDAADVAHDVDLAAADPALVDYIRRHRIGAMLDAPVRSNGTLVGVVCHEQIGAARRWSAEDVAFAASIGDYVALANEISRRRDAEDRLRYLELHDPLTDLPNREHMLGMVHSALRPLGEAAPALAVLHVQVEPGAAAADDAALLAEVGMCLRNEFAEVATLARVRERAFALLPHAARDEHAALEVAGRCLSLVQAVEGSATVGIAFARDLPAPSADMLLHNAELASQRARSGGSNRCEVFDTELHRGLLGRLGTERMLRQALAQDRLELHYQPEIDLRTGCWVATEALLRCRDDDGELVCAGDFIEVAESSGLIVEMGRWVLEQACRTARDWRAPDGTTPLLRVNVSARQFEHADLVDDVARALVDSGLPPSRLCLELTETALLAGPEQAGSRLAALRALGVQVALDDFGTGYCSLAYLKHLPIDALKLDRGFIQGLPDDRYDRAIVEVVTGLARTLGIHAVAEGVETQAQAQALQALGVTRAQGYLYARPLDGTALRAGFCSR